MQTFCAIDMKMAMRVSFCCVVFSLLTGAPGAGTRSKIDTAAMTPDSAYLAFDRNDYPGDAALLTLRRTFSFT